MGTTPSSLNVLSLANNDKLVLARKKERPFARCTRQKVLIIERF